MENEHLTKYLTKFLTANNPEVSEKFRRGEYDSVLDAAVEGGLFKEGDEPGADIEQFLGLWSKMSNQDRRLMTLMIHDELPPDLFNPDEFFSPPDDSKPQDEPEPEEEASKPPEEAADAEDEEDILDTMADTGDEEAEEEGGGGWDSLEAQMNEEAPKAPPSEEIPEGRSPTQPKPAAKKEEPVKVQRWVALEKKLAKTRDLPTLPAVFTEVLRVAADPKSDIQSLQKVIVQDPTLSSTILRLANSAYYGIGKDITSLNMALVVIGFREICNIATSLSVLKAFPKSVTGRGFNFDTYWMHSAGVAATSRVLADRFHARWREELYLAGLLHDIGVQFLATYFPQDVIRILDYAAAEGIPQWQAELKLYSTDHARVGAYLAGVWKLPKTLRSLIRYHHEVWHAGQLEYEAAIIHLANEFCTMDDTEQEFVGLDPERLQKHPAWRIVTGNKPISLSEINELLEKMAKEAETAKEFILNTITQS